MYNIAELWAGATLWARFATVFWVGLPFVVLALASIHEKWEDSTPKPKEG
jgi:hypothetical protein